MKVSRIGLVLGAVLALLAMALDADATSMTARARCRVKDSRVKIQVDGQDLAAGTYHAVLTNNDTGASASTETGKEQTLGAVGDVDLDFDSTAQAADNDSFIDPSFAALEDSVHADVKNASNVTVASATTTCTK